MEVKKLLGTTLTVLGIIGLIVSVFGLFSGGAILGINAYAASILGLIFFSSGISLMKTVKSVPPQ